MLRQQRDHHGGVLTALTLVDRAGVGRHQVIELSPAVDHHPAPGRSGIAAGLAGGEQHTQLAVVSVDGIDGADITVEHLLLVVIGDLHHLVARCETPAKALHLLRRIGIQQLLQLDVE